MTEAPLHLVRPPVAASTALAGLSDSERLLVCCLRTIAHGVAEGTQGMGARDASRHVDAALFELRQSLGPVSESFAAETECYLRNAIAQARGHR